MARSRWINDRTGQPLSAAELARFRALAHRAYAANTHIFEDEHDALRALGVMPLEDHLRSLAVAA